MGLFNEYGSKVSDTTSSQQGQQGPAGPQGIGFKLDANGTYDIENKKITNVKHGDKGNDVMVKNQIEGYVSNKTQYLDNVLPAKVTNNKAVIYSSSGSIHSNALYLKDQYGQEVHFHTEDQDDNQIRLYIPNLKNNDSYGGRLKSDIMVTSILQSIPGKKIFHDIEVPTPTIDGHASNMAYVNNEITKISDNYVRKSGDTMTGPLIVPKDNYPIQGDLNKVISYETQREIFLSKKEGGKMLQPIDMNGFSIDNLPLPTAVDHASTKGYTDNRVDFKADKSDLNDYMKLDGSKVMTGTLNMNNNRITNLPSPHLSTEPATKDYVTTVMNHLPSLFVDRQGKSKMLGNLQMDGNRITGLTNSPNDDDEATNKKYIDSQISKANIKPSHTPKNVFKYLMEDVNEWSTEYNVRVENFSDLTESPHSLNKRVLDIIPIKDGANYRFRVGIQAYPLEMNQIYSLVVELYNKDYKTWLQQETYVQGTGIYIKSHNTSKFQHQYGSSGDIYYTKTMIKFRKTSSAPNQIYFTIHYDDNGGDLNIYPKEFSNQVYIVAYGILGDTNHVDSKVYDAHQAFEIEKTKMKMLVPLDMNNKKIINIGNLSNDNIINIYGNLNNTGIFKLNDMQLKLDNSYITSIFVKASISDESVNASIDIELSDSNIIKYPFLYPNRPSIVKILINKFFNKISSIRILNSTNNPYIIQYKLFY